MADRGLRVRTIWLTLGASPRETKRATYPNFGRRANQLRCGSRRQIGRSVRLTRPPVPRGAMTRTRRSRHSRAGLLPLSAVGVGGSPRHHRADHREPSVVENRIFAPVREVAKARGPVRRTPGYHGDTKQRCSDWEDGGVTDDEDAAAGRSQAMAHQAVDRRRWLPPVPQLPPPAETAISRRTASNVA